MSLLERVDFEKGGGLVPVIAQDHRTGQVLMLGYADREALERSLETGLLTFRSRSRDRLWTKGETSGNVLRIVELQPDCDGDTVLALVDPAGPACHTGAVSCFPAAPTLPDLAATLTARRAADPATSYTARLLADRNHRLKKLGEEAVELAVACADGDRDRVAEEAADLVYHVLTACLAADVELSDVLGALRDRAGRPSTGSPGDRRSATVRDQSEQRQEDQ
jgi:phosphoribosyl-AMP cyclohydrolase / phosphoribosyl-ATP pyrophosphohydrolase